MDNYCDQADYGIYIILHTKAPITKYCLNHTPYNNNFPQIFVQYPFFWFCLNSDIVLLMNYPNHLYLYDNRRLV